MSFDISVILPVYNGEEYIEDTLKSILNQDFKNFEIIIINDGSTDNSLNIINNVLKDSKISYKIINQENKGVSHARNVGLKNSKAKFVVFVDDDDLIAHNHLSCLFNNGKNRDGSFTKMLKINEKREIIQNENIYSPINNKISISAKNLIKLELKMQIPFSFCQIMYKKKLLKENFNENVNYGEDTEFALKNLVHMEDIGICPEVTYFYRQREDSSTKKADFKRFEFINILEEIYDYYDKSNEDDLKELIITNRIPKAIFGNLMYFFYNNYDFTQIMEIMNQFDLLNKLKNFNGEFKFKFKITLFMLNPKIYYKFWKTFKDDIS